MAETPFENGGEFTYMPQNPAEAVGIGRHKLANAYAALHAPPQSHAYAGWDYEKASRWGHVLCTAAGIYGMWVNLPATLPFPYPDARG